MDVFDPGQDELVSSEGAEVTAPPIDDLVFPLDRSQGGEHAPLLVRPGEPRGYVCLQLLEASPIRCGGQQLAKEIPRSRLAGWPTVGAQHSTLRHDGIHELLDEASLPLP